MALFGKLAGKVFKSVKKKLFGPTRPLPYQEEEAEKIMTAQAKRREALLKRRVKAGKSERVYKNRKFNQPTTFYFNGKAVGDSPPLELFLDGYPFARFASSNVLTIVYDRRTESLYIQFVKSKRWYRYGHISLAEAKSLYPTPSKGIWTWDHLRIRGTINGHKKPVTKNSPPPHDLPLGLEDDE